jgi:hypothetical protein
MQHWEAIAHELMSCNVVERRECPDVHDVAVQPDLSAEGQTTDVNHRLGVADTNPHPVQELGAARQKRDSRARCGIHGLTGRSGSGV